MKRRASIFGVFALLLGFFLGSLCPSGLFPWSSLSPFRLTSPVTSPSPPSDQSVLNTLQISPAADTSLDTLDNSALLQAACAVVDALAREDYRSLSKMVHSELGVTFTPYSTVDLVTDLTFTAPQIAALASDEQVYIWGIIDGRGDPIQMTIPEYIRAYVYNADYAKAPRVGIDEVLQSGNALENVSEVYASARFVEFNFPGTDPEYGGMDWCSLKTVLLPENGSWKLIGLIHSQWTI